MYHRQCEAFVLRILKGVEYFKVTNMNSHLLVDMWAILSWKHIVCNNNIIRFTNLDFIFVSLSTSVAVIESKISMSVCVCLCMYVMRMICSPFGSKCSLKKVEVLLAHSFIPVQFSFRTTDIYEYPYKQTKVK